MQKRKTALAVLAAALLVTSAGALAACGGDDGKIEADPLTGSVIADFSQGESEAFFASDGWTNGGSFNVFWTKENVTYSSGALHLAIADEEKTVEGADGTSITVPHTAGEARSVLAYGYGDFSVKMRPEKKVGTASTFFTYTGPTEYDEEGNPNPHDEIDIEFLGKDTTMVQFNYFVNGKGGHEYKYDLGFDAAEEYHEYGFRWAKDRIVWFVDGEPVYEVKASESNPLPSHPGRILMNYWCGSPQAYGWMGEYAGAEEGESADYAWVKSSAQGKEIPAAPVIPDGDAFAGDWSQIAETDLTFAGDSAYTVSKNGSVTNVTYSSVGGQSYINVAAPIAQAAAEKNWLHLTLANNGTETVRFRVNIMAGGKNANLAGYMDGAGAFTDTVWGGTFFEIPAGRTVEAEINFAGGADTLEFMIDSSCLDSDPRAGSVSISAIKFAKQGDIEQLPGEGGGNQTDDDTLTVNGKEITFEGNIGAPYRLTADKSAGTLNVKYDDLAGGGYQNINALVSTIASSRDIFTVKITNHGTAQAKVRIDIDSLTKVAETTACNVSATQDGNEVYTDTTYGGSTFYIDGGREIVAQVKYDTSRGPQKVFFYFDSATYGDTGVYSGDLTLSEMEFGGESGGGFGPGYIEFGEELWFAPSDVYDVSPAQTNTGTVNVRYTQVAGGTYSNVAANIAEVAAGKNTFAVKIKNNGTAAVTIRFDIQGERHAPTGDGTSTDACNSSNPTVEGNGASNYYTDLIYGGTYVTVEAGAEIVLIFSYDGEGGQGAAQTLLIYLDSATYGDSATHSGDVTLSEFTFWEN